MKPDDLQKTLESFLQEGRVDSLVKRAEKVVLTHLDDGSMSFSVSIRPDQAPEIKFPKAASLIRVYGAKLGSKAKVERHPNSFQVLVSIRGKGSTKTFGPNGDFIEGTFNDRYWSFVPENVWHEPIAATNDWVAVTFHSAPESTLIYEYRN